MHLVSASRVHKTRWSRQCVCLLITARARKQWLVLKVFYSHHKLGVILQHDNAKSHIVLAVRETITWLNCEVLPNSPYYSDFAPSDYYLFLNLQSSLDVKVFISEDHSKTPPSRSSKHRMQTFSIKEFPILKIDWEDVQLRKKTIIANKNFVKPKL